MFVRSHARKSCVHRCSPVTPASGADGGVGRDPFPRGASASTAASWVRWLRPGVKGCALKHRLSCICRWFFWGLTSFQRWCPACKIASRRRLAQVRGLCVCVCVTTTLVRSPLAAVCKAFFVLRRALRRLLVVSGSSLHGERRGAVPL